MSEHKIPEGLPPYIYGHEAGPNEKVWTEAAIHEALRAQAAGPEDMAVYQGIADGYQRDAQAAGVVPVAWWRISYVDEQGNGDADVNVGARHPSELGLSDNGFPWEPLYASAPPAHVPADVGAPWPTIDTAPRDGQLMLLGCKGWLPADLRGEPWPVKVGGYWDGKWNIFGASWQPTHWTPLPKLHAGRQHSTPEPVQAVDALTDKQIIGFLKSAGVEFLRFMGGIGSTKQIHSTAGSQDVSKIVVGVRAAIAAYKPQAQHSGYEVLIALLEKSRKALSEGIWDYGPGQDEYEACASLCKEIDAALATKEQRS